jgi:hypothetical protein
MEALIELPRDTRFLDDFVFSSTLLLVCVLLHMGASRNICAVTRERRSLCA